ncbi:MAG: hypothetical protein JSW11_00110 [Candidatus Heimdallarchaeota archaeon]|nr:MAG: hypothetical protein JSW11_00110 [Candidatus Heimdallarchaeota archaeon]
MKPKKNLLTEIGINDDDRAQLTDRALILLSFKDTETQNLGYLLNLLEIRTLKQKENILREIFRLIQEGIVFIPQGLAKIIDQGTLFNLNDAEEIRNIDLCLLCPYNQLIKEIQDEIIKLRKEKNVQKS